MKRLLACCLIALVSGIVFSQHVNASSLSEAIPNHSPLFYIDEAVLAIGMRAMAHLAVDYLETD